MSEVLARCAFRGPAEPDAVEALHEELELLWEKAPFVSDMDRMTFATAVVEAASNVVQHCVAEPGATVELGVDITVSMSLLRARISEYGAVSAEPDLEHAGLPDDESESGRGLALIRALVTTVTYERQGDTNVWTLCREPAPDGR
jgi:serine/threonine-protein kinase RsbW